MRSFDLTYLSLGAGVQSSALLAMAALGLKNCPRPDVVLFADTHGEGPWTMHHLPLMLDFARSHGLRAESVTRGSLATALIEGRADSESGSVPTIPAYVRGENGKAGPLMRTCSKDYKIVPQERKVREILDRVGRPATDLRVRDLLGISIDEAHRMKASRSSWIVNVFPLVDARMTWHDCVRLLQELGLPVPWKSACVFCPWHDNATWLKLKTTWPEQFAAAVAVDKQIRPPQHGRREEAFLHRSLQPLDEINFAKLVAERDYSPLFSDGPQSIVGACDEGTCMT